MEREAEHQREAEVGEFLRARRLHVGLSLPEASRVLCIREAYLKAIEDGRFADMPGPTYVTGFIRTYAEYLGLDGNEVVRRLRAEPLNMDSGSELRFPSPMSEGGMPSGAILLLGVVVALVAYGAWYIGSERDETIAEFISPLPERLVAFLGDGNGESAENEVAPLESTRETPLPQRTAPHTPSAPADRPPPVSAAREPSAEDPDNPPDDIDLSMAARNAGTGGNTDDAESRIAIVAPLAAGDPDEQAAPGEMTDAGEPPTANASEVLEPRILLRAKSENWIEIREEGTNLLILSRLFKPGDTYDVPNGPDLKLLTGNAGGLEIIVDGETVPALGAEGMVRRNVPLDADRLRSGDLARN